MTAQPLWGIVQSIGRLSVLFVFVALLVAGTPSAWAAPGGYGPGLGPTGPTNAPGGYSDVLTTRTFGPGGGAIEVAIPGGRARVLVPPHSLPPRTQLEITAPNLDGIRASLPRLGYADFAVVAGVGLKLFDEKGNRLTGNLARAVSLKITSASLGRDDQVVRFTGPTTAVRMAASVTPGSVTVEIDADPDIAVLSPPPPTGVGRTPPPTKRGQPPTKVLGEEFTLPYTGQPLFAEALLGTLLVVFGVAAVLTALRGRRRGSGSHRSPG